MSKYAFRRNIVLILIITLLNTAFPAYTANEYPFVAYTSQIASLVSDTKDSKSEVAKVQSGSAVAVIGEDDLYFIVIYEGKTGYILKSLLQRELSQFQSSVVPPEEMDVYTKYISLSRGSSGEHVKALQQALKELGFLTGKADGKYGPATEKAVSTFQGKNKLTVTGGADPETQRYLYEENPLNSKGKRTNIKTLSISAEILRPGDSGLPVENLQSRLKELGYYKGKVDGKYGNNTKNAVRDFQRANKLKADGIAGQKTNEALNNPSVLSKGATAPPVQATDKPIEISSKSSEAIQSQLFTMEMEEATYPYTTTTSDSVNLRKRATVRSTRLATIPNGASIEVIKTSGDFLNVRYKNRQGFVLANYVNIPEQYLPGESFTYDSDARVKYETLGQGVSGSLVTALQQALKELGFYSGAEDGIFGGSTIQAVKDFQTKNGYKATGIALPEMQKLIYEGKPRNAKNRKVSVDILPPVPNPDMQIGDKGEAVADLQRTLTTLGFYKGEIDGNYGRSTSNAVKAYQKAHSIRQTGKMNNFTWLSLNAAMQTPTPGDSSPMYELNEDNVIVMYRGTRGLAVTRLEERLIELGYYNRTPNGVYENQDMDAVRQFQRNNGFTSTGIADLYTQRALYSSNAIPSSESPPEGWQKLTTDTPVPTATLSAAIYGLLKIGSRGDEVLSLQNRLIALGYLTGKADGIYGTQTARAVTSFQKANNLKADGLAGQDTLSLISSVNASSNVPSQTPQDTTTGELSRNLSMGTSGSDVAQAQRMLISLRFLDGAADGIFGPATAIAVQAFQENNNLKPDGIIGSLTWAKLHSSQASSKGSVPIAPIKPIVPTQPSPPTAQTFKAPSAKEVRFALWDKEVKSHSIKLPYITIYDFISGLHYNVHVFSNGNHADGEPITAEDTATMEKALGENNWTPRPVWVIFSDGKVYMASTHSRGHEVDHNPNNNLTGHICIHYPREMSLAESVGPYAVSHQNAMLAGWDLTQEMAK